MPYYRCCRDFALTFHNPYLSGKPACKLCGGTLESSLSLFTDKATIQSYKDALDRITCKREILWNENFTRIVGQKLYTEKGIVEEYHDDDYILLRELKK